MNDSSRKGRFLPVHSVVSRRPSRWQGILVAGSKEATSPKRPGRSPARSGTSPAAPRFLFPRHCLLTGGAQNGLRSPAMGIAHDSAEILLRSPVGRSHPGPDHRDCLPAFHPARAEAHPRVRIDDYTARPMQRCSVLGAPSRLMGKRAPDLDPALAKRLHANAATPK